MDQTAVGRFGAGHAVEPNTASQDLLAWNVLCDGSFFEARVYDEKVRPISLGSCGITAGPSKQTKCEVEGINWTGLTCRLLLGTETVSIRESLLTPALWFHTDGPALRFFQPLPGRPATRIEEVRTPTASGLRHLSESYVPTRDGRLTQPWFVALVKSGDREVPVLAILRRAPEAVEWSPKGGLLVRWSRGGNDLGLLPLSGSRAAARARQAASADREVDESRAAALAARFLWVPTGLKETYRITPRGVAVRDELAFESAADQWGWSKRSHGYALVPPAVANARRYGYPVSYDRKVEDLEYPAFTSSLCLATDSNEITYTLPFPDLYGTIVAPAADASLEPLLAPEVGKTIRDYSKYVIDTYKNKPGYVFGTSAIGEARALMAEYGCYRMMSPEARRVFDAWADQAAKDRIFNCKGFYGYGKDVASPRRFLIDDYRLGDNDYEDAGWFGYDIATMWERAFFANRWKDVRDNWPWIREMFYGWNWVYTDYAVGYSPLFVDASNGGAGRGYTDNMAMLPAMYAWARMADKMGDKATLADALYMLARERVGRYNRMTVYDYSRKCGYDTQSVFTVSDQANGPNLSPADGYLPGDSKRWLKGAVVDFGPHNQGLWFLTGSFLEPPSVETLEMVLGGDMKRRVADAYKLIDDRYPRWWAAPAAAETSNYQVFMRGALLHDDPVRLRYFFDYQEGLGNGLWSANAFHPYAFLGIALSPYRTLECRRYIHVRRLEGEAWVPVKDEIQFDILVGPNGSGIPVFWNSTGKRQTLKLSLVRGGPGTPAPVADAYAQSGNLFEGGTPATLTVPPGLAVFPPRGDHRMTRGVELEGPAAVQVMNGRTTRFPVVLANRTPRPIRCSLLPKGMSLDKRELVVSPWSVESVEAEVDAGDECAAPYDVFVKVRSADREVEYAIQVLILPSVVALLDLEGETYARSPELANARVFATNRLDEPTVVNLSWSLGYVAKGEKKLELGPHTAKEWNVPLRCTVAEPMRAMLKALVTAPHFGQTERERRVRVFPPLGTVKEPRNVVLYDFEESDTDGWFMPPWADGNQDDEGTPRQPYTAVGPATSGTKALESPIQITAGRLSAAFFGVKVGADWRPFKTLAVDVYLPPDAPTGLEGRYYFIGSDWKWREPLVVEPLKPGAWTTLRVPLSGPEGARFWKLAEAPLSEVMGWVLEFGVKICNIVPNFVGFRGKVRVDNVRIEGR